MGYENSKAVEAELKASILNSPETRSSLDAIKKEWEQGIYENYVRLFKTVLWTITNRASLLYDGKVRKHAFSYFTRLIVTGTITRKFIISDNPTAPIQ